MLRKIMNKTVKVNVTKCLADASCDAPILVVDTIISSLSGTASKFQSCINKAADIDPSAFKSGVTVIPTDQHPSGRLIVSMTGNLDRDYDDGRRFYEASCEGVNRAVKMGLKNPLLMLGGFSTLPSNASWGKFPSMQKSGLLGALNALYVPIEIKEYSETSFGKNQSIKGSKADSLYLYQDPSCNSDYAKIAEEAWAIEEGKRVARDIGGSDPIRMAAKRIVEYLQNEFNSSSVKMEAVEVSEKDYPLAAAVNRGSKDNLTLDGRIVKLEYGDLKSSTKQLFLVGKGITYDTGGHDLKVGGNMACMHRDKCGAGVVAGFFKTLSLLNPKGLRCVGRLGCIRNAIGPDAYVSDEVITSRAGVRVRVNNTDAEGRMAMADLLGEMVEQASEVPNPTIFTVATLTGHAMNTYGENYGAIVANRPARSNKLDFSLQASGEHVSDMFEISRLRREDWKAHVAALDDYTDLTNSFATSGKTYRGHQSPAVFLMQAAGLDRKLDASPDCNLQYVHLDIAGPEVKSFPNPPNASGLGMLVQHFIL